MPDDELAKKLEVLTDLAMWEWPEDARDTILAGLASADPAVRRTAVDLAPELMDDDLAGEVLKILDSDPDEEIRARAAIAFGPALQECWEEADFGGEFSDPPLPDERYHEIEERFQGLFEDQSTPKEIRRRVLEAAVRSPQPWHREAVRAAHASDDPQWQATAIFCMGQLGEFHDEILAALKSDDPDIEFEAVRAAGEAEVEAAGSEIYNRAASETTDPAIRLAAIRALPYLSPSGTRELLESLSESDDEEIADTADEAMDDLLLSHLSELAFSDDDSEMDDDSLVM